MKHARTSLNSHASAIRARLRRPPNAVPDRGINLGGRAIAAALAENMQRNMIEALQFAEQMRREARNERKKVAK